MSGEPLRLHLLGPLRASRGATPLDLGPVRQQALLAALVLSPDVPVGAAALLDRVWGADVPGTGAKLVATYIYRLRRCLRGPEPVLVTEPAGYRFRSPAAWVDVARFDETVADAAEAHRSGDLAAAVASYTEALALFHGDEALTGLPGPFAERERIRLAERRFRALRDKLACQLALGAHAETVDELSALVRRRPADESLSVLLMRALHADGRRDEALTVFRELRRHLADEAGYDPGPEAQRVHRDILRGEETAARAPSPNELPADIGDLVGRDGEIRALTAPAPHDAVSVRAVDGIPGAGKTALAVHAARLLSERFPGGRVFIDLHGHTAGRPPLTAAHALRRLLRALGAGDGVPDDDVDGLAAAWRTATASARLLLVLDDASGAEQVRTLLPAGPGSLVLVTSRRRLAGLDAGVRVSLGPLDPGAAEELLARIVGGSRAGRETAAVRELARLCDRLPLALRIAGARLQSRPVWAVADLVRRLADDRGRLGELAAESRSVAAAFALSHGQLPEAERRLFGVLGWCPSSEHDPLLVSALLECTVDEAEDALENLLDANLLQQQVAGRYRMHDLIRAYARQATTRTGLVAEVHARGLRLYAAAFRQFSDRPPETYASGLPGLPEPFADRRAAAHWLDAMTDEIGEVVGHAASLGLHEYVCLLAEASLDYLLARGRFHEYRRILGTALALTEDAAESRVRCVLLLCMGAAYAMLNRFEEAETWFHRGLALARQGGHHREETIARGTLGGMAMLQNRNDEAAEHLAGIIEPARELGDAWAGSMAHANLGTVHHREKRHEEAFRHFDNAVELAEGLDAPRILAIALGLAAGAHLDLGHHETALALLERAHVAAEGSDDVPVRSFVLGLLGTVHRALGREETAIELRRRAADLLGGLTGIEREVEARNRLATAHLSYGDRELAYEQYERVLALTEDGSFPEQRERARAGLDAVTRKPFHRDSIGGL